MESVPGGPPAVNAGGADPATPPPPPPAATSFPPCPECGGEVMRYLSRDLSEDELLSLECWWSVPTAHPPHAWGPAARP
jgi:hypothetical protein